MLGVGARRRWRIAELTAGLIATTLLMVLGCTKVSDGTPASDANDARSYRAWMADSMSQSAAAASERESTRRESETAVAVADACETLSSTSVEVVTAINGYVNAVATGHEPDVSAKAQSAADTLNRGADTVAGRLNTALWPQMADAFRAWVDATRAVAKAIAERYGQQEFNAEVDKFNQANETALDTCGGSH